MHKKKLEKDRTIVLSFCLFPFPKRRIMNTKGVRKHENIHESGRKIYDDDHCTFAWIDFKTGRPYYHQYVDFFHL